MTSIDVIVDLRANFGPARDQLQRPTCLAFAVSDAHAGIRGGWLPLSCEYLYFCAIQRAGRSPDSGATLDSALTAMAKDGQPAETAWPYLPVSPREMTQWTPPTPLGELFGRNGTRVQHTLDAVFTLLKLSQPVILLMCLSQSFYLPDAFAVVRPGQGEMADQNARHAVIAVGCGAIANERAVLVRNSWGPGWGEQGYAWLTEAFLGPRLFAAALLTDEVHVSSHPNAA